MQGNGHICQALIPSSGDISHDNTTVKHSDLKLDFTGEISILATGQ